MNDPRASEIEAVLDRCIEAARSGGDPEEILGSHSDVAAEVRPLLALAAELGALPEPSPSMAGMMKALARLSREGPGASRGRARFFSVPALARAAAVLACVFGLGWGAVAASSGAVPGDLFYPVKLLTEHVQFFLAVSRGDQIELRIVFSQRRLEEAIRKYQRGAGIDRELLQAMLDESQKALDASPGLPEASRGFVVSKIAYASDLQRRTLEQIGGRLGPEQKAHIEPFLRACDSRCQRMCEVLGCGRPDAGADPFAPLLPPCTCPRCPADDRDNR